MKDTKTTKTNNLSELYLVWLLNLINADNYKGKSYIKLCSLLNKVPFEPVIKLDENRLSDVQSLLRETYIQSQSEWYRLTNDDIMELPTWPVSFLELIISLAMRIDLDFMREINGIDNTRIYFWVLVRNLGILEFDDEHWGEDAIISIVNRLNIVQDRKYDFNGNGGLFPLENAEMDQRNVQIWNQLCQFVNQRFLKIG
ncbi:MAG: hypothetical protein J6Y02_13095 [Pseudobutyrivibrio sp.]|nr:hypothetical protein [Pseudobutyrivibrio sp.]